MISIIDITDFFSKKKHKPDFLIIGTQKGGTTTLYDLITQHPEINAAKKKEVHYFDLNFHRSLRWYHSFFSYGKITGEASPYYLFHPLVPERIKSIFPEIKLIVILRNPIDRAFSHYNMILNRGKETLTFEDAISAENDRLQREIKKIKTQKNYRSYDHQYFSYLSRGEYYRQISHWYKYFPENQFMFIQSEQFFLHTQKTLDNVFSFLGIDSFIPEVSISRKGNYNDDLSNETRAILQTYFKKHNNDLYDLLGVNYNW